MKTILGTACVCLTASALTAEPRRVLLSFEMDRVAAGACLVGTVNCNDTPMPPPYGLGPIAPMPIGWSFVLPGFASQFSTCGGTGWCAASSSAAAGD